MHWVDNFGTKFGMDQHFVPKLGHSRNGQCTIRMEESDGTSNSQKWLYFFSTTKRKKSVAQTNLDCAERLFQKTLDEALQMVRKTRKFYIRI